MNERPPNVCHVPHDTVNTNDTRMTLQMTVWTCDSLKSALDDSLNCQFESYSLLLNDSVDDTLEDRLRGNGGHASRARTPLTTVPPHQTEAVPEVCLHISSLAADVESPRPRTPPSSSRAAPFVTWPIPVKSFPSGHFHGLALVSRTRARWRGVGVP